MWLVLLACSTPERESGGKVVETGVEGETGDTPCFDGDESPMDVDLASASTAKFLGNERGGGGFSYYGGSWYLSFGDAADFDGDGDPDLRIAFTTFNPDDSTIFAGRVYLARAPFGGTTVLEDVSTRITGQDVDNMGGSLAPAGDVNGDGVGDLLVGAPGFRATAGDSYQEGQAYLFLGPVVGDLAGDDAASTFHGVPDTAWGPYVAGGTGSNLQRAGDVDGDGFDDILIGMDGYDGGEGAVVYVRGPAPGLHELETDADARIGGSFRLGYVAAGVGDTDGDGCDDVVVDDEVSTPVIHMFLGPIAGELDVDSADARVEPEEEDLAFVTATALGDVDADGLADFAIRAPNHVSATNSRVGGVYVFRGPLSAAAALEDAVASFSGTERYTYAGDAAAVLADADGDGEPDLAIGGQTGVTWIVPANACGAFELGDIGTRIVGSDDDRAGVELASAADADHDGLADLLIGAPGDDEADVDAGAAYLILGSSLR